MCTCALVYKCVHTQLLVHEFAFRAMLVYKCTHVCKSMQRPVHPGEHGREANDMNSKSLDPSAVCIVWNSGPSSWKAACGACRSPDPKGDIQRQRHGTAFLRQGIPRHSHTSSKVISPASPPRRSQSLVMSWRTVVSTPSRVPKACNQMPTLGLYLLSRWGVTLHLRK